MPQPPPAPSRPETLVAGGSPVTLRRIDPARDMARFYTLAVEVTLFAEWSCTRRFGRIGTRGGRVMMGLFASEAEARAALARLLAAKVRRGYVAQD